MSVWEKLEGYLDVAVDAAAEGYVASKTPTPTAEPSQPYPQQTVTTVPANQSDRAPTSMQRAAQAIEPYRAYLPWALVALVAAWMLVRSGR
ncbi:MAG: hypothetical protein KA296_13730 [Marinobacter sp.]|nr:hypothetical protein [Marinobacter sp.]